MAEMMLTTVDNPFDPFTQFKEWYAFDVSSGYNTLEMLARITKTSDELSEADQEAAINHAIDEIFKENAIGVYRKVEKPDGADTNQE